MTEITINYETTPGDVIITMPPGEAAELRYQLRTRDTAYNLVEQLDSTLDGAPYEAITTAKVTRGDNKRKPQSVTITLDWQDAPELRKALGNLPCNSGSVVDRVFSALISAGVKHP